MPRQRAFDLCRCCSGCGGVLYLGAPGCGPVWMFGRGTEERSRRSLCRGFKQPNSLEPTLRTAFLTTASDRKSCGRFGQDLSRAPKRAGDSENESIARRRRVGS